MALTDEVPIPAGINPGVSSAKQATMLSLLGSPRTSFDAHCRPITHPRLAPLIGTADVGPFRATGLKPALDSLKKVFAEVQAANPTLHGALGTAGMLCARLVRGSQHSISNHSWGTAIDLTINGILDDRGDRKVLRGLVDIAPFFNKHGWFWGAGFRTEDAMHFEVSDAKIREWARNGFLGGAVAEPVEILSLGDRGPDVVALQKALKEKAGAAIKADGEFGPATHAAVMAFQATNGLQPDGVVGKRTREKLGI